MAETKNALAELAERLKYHDCRDEDFYLAVDKARRIVAELANVGESHDEDSRLAYFSECVSAYELSHAIAEEGYGNGK